MVESVDTQDLKSCDHNGRAGSSPAPGTSFLSRHPFLNLVQAGFRPRGSRPGSKFRLPFPASSSFFRRYCPSQFAFARTARYGSE